jgi:hypothetical protein
LEGSSSHLIEVLARHLPQKTEETYEKSVRIAGIPSEIRIKAQKRNQWRALVNMVMNMLLNS